MKDIDRKANKNSSEFCINPKKSITIVNRKEYINKN